MPDIPNSVSLLLEIAFAIVFAVILQIVSRPSLIIEPIPDQPGKEMTYVHVRVKNKGRSLFFRETAVNCSSRVLFTDVNTEERIDPFATKWASKPNPLSPALDPKTGGFTLLPDETKIRDGQYEDIVAGASKDLDIAVKIEGDSECYAHTPENFFAPHYRPPKHRLAGRRYLVEIQVCSENGSNVSARYILENTGNSARDIVLRPE